MRRREWTFQYSGAALAAAAKLKVEFHQQRLLIWKEKKEDVMKTIRSEGLHIEKSLSITGHRAKRRDWSEGTQVMVRDDLQRHLDECLEKLSHHTHRLDSYCGWAQVLLGNPESILELNHDDWLFFFGTPEKN